MRRDRGEGMRKHNRDMSELKRDAMRHKRIIRIALLHMKPTKREEHFYELKQKIEHHLDELRKVLRDMQSKNEEIRAFKKFRI